MLVWLTHTNLPENRLEHEGPTHDLTLSKFSTWRDNIPPCVSVVFWKSVEITVFIPKLI